MRLMVYSPTNANMYLQNAFMSIESANMGVSDIESQGATITQVTGTTSVFQSNTSEHSGVIYRL